MKTLELNLQKRLLIVEVGEIEEIIDVQPDFNTALLQGKKFIAVKGNHKLICKGDELTEKICETLISKKEVAKYQSKMCGLKFKEGFVKAIESQGYYWGENPIKLIERGEDTERNRVLNQDQWREAESKTFNSEKSLIFEIIDNYINDNINIDGAWSTNDEDLKPYKN